MTLVQIIKDIARRHRVPTALAGGFVQEAIEGLIRALESGRGVTVPGLGSFRWQQVKERAVTGALRRTRTQVPSGWKLRFVPARRFRGRRTAMSDSDGMTKYGVELDDSKTKQASKGSKPCRCPACGSLLDDAGACPVHGTEPLESPGAKR